MTKQKLDEIFKHGAEGTLIGAGTGFFVAMLILLFLGRFFLKSSLEIGLLMLVPMFVGAIVGASLGVIYAFAPNGKAKSESSDSSDTSIQ